MYIYILQIAQNYAAILVLGNFNFINYRVEDIVKSLNWQTVKERFTYLTSVSIIFKAIHDLISNHISDDITIASDIHESIPTHKYAILKIGFMYNSIEVWHNLSEG